jgi:O-antigen ligase
MHTPPFIALALCVLFMVHLFRRDARQNPNVTGALWIPFIWMLIIMSRFVTTWVLILTGINLGGTSVEEGSPVDALCSLVLIIAGMRVLYRRQVQFGVLVRQNGWIAIFFVYCFLSVLWSDDPFVSFKRWFKVLGQPIMALIILTEPDLEAAVCTFFKRLAFVVIPVSVLLIKYYPEYGRGFSFWTGQAYNQGIAPGKNQLGVDCVIVGFFYVWYTMKVWAMEKGRARRIELFYCGFFLFWSWWLMDMAQSSTSLVSCVLGIILLILMGRRWIRLDSIGTYIVAAVVVLAVGDYLFQISDFFFQLVGRDRTLTDRTKVWEDCLKVPINPIIGVGFESFWSGTRQEMMSERWKGAWVPNEAHNGYLETYLNIGLVGLFFLAVMLFFTYWKTRRELLTNFHWGRFRTAFLFSTLVYNWTEASFKALHPMYFMFYLIALDYPRLRPVPEPEPVEVTVEPLEGVNRGEESVGQLEWTRRGHVDSSENPVMMANAGAIGRTSDE